VPPQDTITKDNVSITVDAVIYYKIVNPGASVIEVSDFASAISQLAQTSMRNAIGEVPLDALLSQRDEISDKIKVMVDKVSTPWGIKVISLQLKHIELPDDMKRVMAKAAEAERFKKATIIRSEGENIAAEAIAQAAGILNSADGALNLRTLQSLNDIASDPSNTVTFFVPLDIIKNYSGDAKSSKRK
jgi:regulator of protease activity HflC (stomatin/prohibitin superfamily)